MRTVSIHEPIHHDDGDLEWDLPDTQTLDPLQEVIRREEKDLIEDAIAQLGPTLRSAITLRHLHGLRYDEIAEILEIPLGTVKVRIFRARAALAQILAVRLEEDEG